jgi:hypothetical protein
MNKKNNESYSKGTILIILILFMFSSKLLIIAWDIGKSAFYIFLIIYGLNILNPNISNKIKEMLFDVINFGNNNIFKNILSTISSFFFGIFKNGKQNNEIRIIKKKRKLIKKKINDVDNSKVSNVRSLDNRPNNIGRKLA